MGMLNPCDDGDVVQLRLFFGSEELMRIVEMFDIGVTPVREWA
jgi:hypothetical protein